MRAIPFACALVLLSCHRQPAPKPAASPSPTAPPAAAQAAGVTVAGKVLERIDAGVYSYLRLDTLQGEQWAAVRKCELRVGDQAVVTHAMAMDGFESRTLNRKFERIVFGILEGEGAPGAGTATPPSPHGQAGDVHGGTPPAPPAELGPIAVRRASGPDAATVAELYAKKAALRDQPVAVRAKVVKVLPGIMGKNWLHVRDGSGSEEKRDNDLTVTTDDVATVGSVVLVQGRLHTDKDLGSGYRFSVIVEDAKVTKE
jgi:hypothetical protein